MLKIYQKTTFHYLARIKSAKQSEKF